MPRDKVERTRISKLAMLRKHHQIEHYANTSDILFDVNRGKFNTFLNNNRTTIQKIMDELSALTEEYFELIEKDGKRVVKTTELAVGDKVKKIEMTKPGKTREDYEKAKEKIENEMVVYVMI